MRLSLILSRFFFVVVVVVVALCFLAELDEETTK